MPSSSWVSMRRVWPAVVLVALAAVAYAVLGRSGRAPEPRYETAVVDHGPITATVTATGTVNPVATVEVGTYVSGPIQSIYADFNTPIRRGQLLAKIDPRPFQVKVDGAGADLATAQAKLAKDRADARLKATTLGRQRELARRGIVAQSDLDVAVSEQRQADAQLALDEAEIHSAEAKLHEAEVNLAYTDIVAPVDGVVVARNVSPGQTVAASFQTPTLFLVAEDLTKMLVSASVSESDIGGVRANQDATFTVDAYPASTFQGRVSQVRNAPVTVQNVVTYDVLVTVDNADLRLKPGMTANVNITTAARSDAVRVPTGALRFRPPQDGTGAEPAAGPAVWLAGPDGPRRTTVAIGIADERFTEVTSGLSEGERVITALARDGSQSSAVRGSPPSFGPARRAH